MKLDSCKVISAGLLFVLLGAGAAITVELPKAYRKAVSEGVDKEVALAPVRGVLRGLDESQPASWSEQGRQDVRGALRAALSASANSAVAAGEVEALAQDLLQADLAREAHWVRCRAQRREPWMVRLAKHNGAVSPKISKLPGC